MPELSTSLVTAEAVSMLSGVADATRLRLLSLIAHNGETCVCDLVEATGLSQTSVSRHLSTLRNAGLVHGRKQGLWVYYSLLKPQSEIHRHILTTIKKAVESVPELQSDLERLQSSCCADEISPIAITLPKKR